MRAFAVVLAMDEAGGIGRDGKLPWRLPGELRDFRRLTVGFGHNAVIMGRATWDSLPTKPLRDRRNIVLSRTIVVPGVTTASSIDHALSLAASAQRVFVIGGAQVYLEALTHLRCETVYLTQVAGAYACDTFVPLNLISEHYTPDSQPVAHSAGGARWTTMTLTRTRPYPRHR